MSKPHTTRKGSQYEGTVPTTRDRVVQAALLTVLEPILGADFRLLGPFRGRLSGRDANQGGRRTLFPACGSCCLKAGIEGEGNGVRRVRPPQAPTEGSQEPEIRLQDGLQDGEQGGLHDAVPGRRDGAFLLRSLPCGVRL